MTLAQLIKLVLDTEYDEIQMSGESEKDEEIAAQLVQLHKQYGRLTQADFKPISYSDPVTRFAYIYKYTIAHADYIMQLIRDHKVLHELFKRDEVDVACLGGGPGSDFLGILKYMIQKKSQATLTCYLFDKERAWGDSWSGVAKAVQSDFRVYPIFQQLDVTKSATWSSYSKYLKCDLFTLSFFMSEVWSIRSAASSYFDYCFAKAKKGSLFLFIDNNDSRFYGWFDSLAHQNGIEILHSGRTTMVFSNDEEKTDLERYYEKFRWPKRESNVAFRIGRKE